LKRRIAQLYDAYAPEKGGFRSHMGASYIGNPCVRQIWYKFRWFADITPPPRLLRLFNRGHLEEGRMQALLDTIGCELFLSDTEDKQYGFEILNGLIGGSCDGVALHVPDVPKGEHCLIEFKTSNAKRFAALTKNGLVNEQLTHYVQMIVYMFKLDLKFGLYLVTNKDTDELYGEILEANDELAESFLERAEQIVRCVDVVPARINESPGWFLCRCCDYKNVCHNKAVPARNCRTCTAFAVVKEDGTIYCANTDDGDALTKEDQLAACNGWEPFTAD